MKIYRESASHYLKQQASIIKAAPKRWRCIYFHFSKLDSEYTEGLRTNIVVNIFTDLLRDEPGFVYLCEDRDVVILFQGPVVPVLDKLGDHVQGMISSKGKSAPDITSLCEVMELRLSWVRFEELCAEKLTHATSITLEKHKGQLNTPDKPYVWDEDLFFQAKHMRPNREKLLALVVEDDPFTRRLVSNVLRPHFDVMETGEGKAAMHIYNINAPDMVFQDIELPDSNGHILLQEMIAHDEEAFVVMLSGNSQKENVIAALEDGAQGFVTKPFPKEKLLHYAAMCQRARSSRLQTANAIAQGIATNPATTVC